MRYCWPYQFRWKSCGREGSWSISTIKYVNTARGPNAINHLIDKSVGLVHTRLAIIDLSETADQPMLCHEEKISIVFNGEIYNFKEMRSELRDLSSRFLTESDTEVIIEAYKAWGIKKTLQRLRGMYSFSSMIGEVKNIYLQEIPLVKPLYLFLRDNSLLFSSSLESLAFCLDKKTDVDESAIAWTLYSYCVPNNKTIYKNVEKISPGRYREYSNDGTLGMNVISDYTFHRSLTGKRAATSN